MEGRNQWEMSDPSARASMSLYGLELPSSATSHKSPLQLRMTSRASWVKWPWVRNWHGKPDQRFSGTWRNKNSWGVCSRKQRVDWVKLATPGHKDPSKEKDQSLRVMRDRDNNWWMNTLCLRGECRDLRGETVKSQVCPCWQKSDWSTDLQRKKKQGFLKSRDSLEILSELAFMGRAHISHFFFPLFVLLFSLCESLQLELLFEPWEECCSFFLLYFGNTF